MKNLQNKLKNSQKFKFVAIGVMNTILDFAILFGLKFLGVAELLANGVSTGVTFVISFILNKKITFQSAGKSRRELAREMILFTTFTLFGLWVIQSVVISTTKPIFSNFLPNFEFFSLKISKESLALLFSKIIATAFSMIWNFVSYKKIVFAAPTKFENHITKTFEKLFSRQKSSKK